MCHTFSAQFFKAPTLTLKGYTRYTCTTWFLSLAKFNGRKDVGHMKEINLKQPSWGVVGEGARVIPLDHNIVCSINILAPSCFVSRLEIPQIALRKGEILIRNKGWPKIWEEDLFFHHFHVHLKQKQSIWLLRQQGKKENSKNMPISSFHRLFCFPWNRRCQVHHELVLFNGIEFVTFLGTKKKLGSGISKQPNRKFPHSVGR
jgi:hypothetical protein